jgi:hypothetical protein
MALVGEYEPNSYTMSMTATNAGRAPDEQMVMKMKVDAKRVGECTAEEAKAAETAQGVGGNQ